MPGDEMNYEIIESPPCEIRIDAEGQLIRWSRAITRWLVGVLSLNLYVELPSVFAPVAGRAIEAYQTACGALMCRLAGHLEGNVVGGGVLDLKGRGRGVVEVLGQELQECERGEQCKPRGSRG
jgi:hypothetical protein